VTTAAPVVEPTNPDPDRPRPELRVAARPGARPAPGYDPALDAPQPADMAPADAAVRTSGRLARREVHAASHEWEWQLSGSCRLADPELFFHPWGERDPSRTRREVAAKAVCATCPVLQHCRAYALDTLEPYGVWGGLSEHDREEILGIRFG